MSNCERVLDVQAMLDGHTEENDELLAHIEECASCKELVDSIEGIRGAVSGMAPENAPDFDEVWPGIRSEIALDKSRRNTVAWLSAAAAACLVALSLISVFSPTRSAASAKSFVESVRSDIEGVEFETIHDEDGTAIVWVNVPEGDMW